jgi:hypothetical protein
MRFRAVAQKSDAALRSASMKGTGMAPGVMRIVVGVVIAAVGGGISLASYANASSSEGGGSYVVWWGLIAVGAWTAFQGLSIYVEYRKAIRRIRNGVY